jgi:hypothetical protein
MKELNKPYFIHKTLVAKIQHRFIYLITLLDDYKIE